MNELKVAAKKIGASLTAHGHQVPHSVVLHAISEALTGHSWHHLKAKASGQPGNDSAALDTLEVVLEWLQTGMVDGVGFDEPQVEEEVLRTLTQAGRLAVAPAKSLPLTVHLFLEVPRDSDSIYSFDVSKWAKEAASPSELQAALANPRNAKHAFVWEAENGNAAAAEALKHVGSLTPAVAYSAQFDAEELIAWLRMHHPELVHDFLCEQFDVQLSEAQEEEIAGMWDWLCEQDACEHSYASREEATAAAVESLSLVQRYLDTLSVD